MKHFIKKIIPENLKKRYRAAQAAKLKAYVSSLPILSAADFRNILLDNLGIEKEDVVFVHSSLDQLNLDFPFYETLNILMDAVGEKGTLLFPTYPPVTSYEFLKTGQIFNIKRTPSYTGILSEFARRHSQSIRSLHPTKSVAAIGPLAKELTVNHPDSPYPYDTNSPYYKIFDHKAKIIGVGVMTTYLSAVHTVDDYLKEKFPVNPYHPELFNAKCIDYDKSVRIVDTYAHDMKKMNFSLPKFFEKYIPKNICEDIDIKGMKFFRALSNLMFDEMLDLADKNITIYSIK